MSYDILDRPLHWITVKWDGLKADPDGGLSVPVEHEIEMHVEIFDKELLAKHFPGTFNADDPEAEAPPEIESLMAIVADWRKVVANGRPVSFTRENMEKLRKVPNFSGGFYVAYMTAVAGKVEIREKNSESSLTNGRADEQAPATKANSSEIAAASE